MKNYVRREIQKEKLEVHVAGSCIEEDETGNIKILVARRSMDREIIPGKLEGCGGQLREGESFEEGVKRHFKQELGVDVEPIANIYKLYEIQRHPKPLIPGVRFLCRMIDSHSAPTLTNHTEVFWMSETQLRRTNKDEFVGDLKYDLVELLDQYRIHAILPQIQTITNEIKNSQFKRMPPNSKRGA